MKGKLELENSFQGRLNVKEIAGDFNAFLNDVLFKEYDGQTIGSAFINSLDRQVICSVKPISLMPKTIIEVELRDLQSFTKLYPDEVKQLEELVYSTIADYITDANFNYMYRVPRGVKLIFDNGLFVEYDPHNRDRMTWTFSLNTEFDFDMETLFFT